MSYEQTTWKDGDIITAEGMNKMEAGIATADTAAQTAQTTAEAAQATADEVKATAEANAEAIAAGEAKDVEQDAAVEAAQSAAEAAQATADTNAAKNVEQDTAIEAAQSAAEAAQSTADANAAKNTEQDTAIAAAQSTADTAKATAEANAAAIATGEEKNTEQDASISAMQQSIDDLSTRMDSAESAITAIDGDMDALAEVDTTMQSQLSVQAGQATVLEQKIALLETQLAALQTKDAVTEDLSSGDVTSEEEIVVTPAAPITTPTTMTAKAVTVKQMEVQSSKAVVTATDGDVSISNVTMTGDLPKATSNAALSANSEGGIVKISGGDMNQTGYNSIEVGLNKLSKMVLIENIDFKANLTNNAISVFGMEEGGTLTISKCHFAKCSNPLRISNRGNTSFTINLVDCVADEWEANPAYAGFICFQDYTTEGDAEAIAAANQFGKDKITVNFINCSGPAGKIVAPADPAAVCGSQTADQLLYVYNDKEAVVAYTGHEDRYPTVNYK